MTRAPGLRRLPRLAPGARSSSTTASTWWRRAPRLPTRCSRAAPGVVVLATSRAPLGVAGETELAGAVAVAARRRDRSRRGRWPHPTRCRCSSSGRAEARPGFALSDGERGVRGRDLRRARRPAAGDRARRRPGADAVGRADRRGLADRFRLLTGGPRTALPRQQTLRASVDWSHELLSDDERALLRRLAVFAGGFTLEAGRGGAAPATAIERERGARPARLAGRPVARHRRGTGLRGPLPPAGDGAPVRARAVGRGRRVRTDPRPPPRSFPRPRRTSGAAPRDRAPAAVARGRSTPRRRTWRRRSTTRCGATRL